MPDDLLLWKVSCLFATDNEINNAPYNVINRDSVLNSPCSKHYIVTDLLMAVVKKKRGISSVKGIQLHRERRISTDDGFVRLSVYLLSHSSRLETESRNQTRPSWRQGTTARQRPGRRGSLFAAVVEKESGFFTQRGEDGTQGDVLCESRTV